MFNGVGIRIKGLFLESISLHFYSPVVGSPFLPLIVFIKCEYLQKLKNRKKDTALQNFVICIN